MGAKAASKLILEPEAPIIGIPGTNQAWASGEHLYQVLEDGEEFTMHQLLFGPERN